MSQIGIRFNAGVEYKGKIFASAVNINGLIQLDLATREMKYIKRFSKEKACFAIHRMAFLYKNEAWFIPQNGRYIAIINLDTLDIQYIEPPFKRINKKAVSQINAVYYSGDIIDGRYLYLIPTNIDTLLLIDLETRKVYPYYDVPEKDEYFLTGTYVKESIQLWPWSGNTIVEINLRTGAKNRFNWKYASETFSDAVRYKNKVWFCPSYSDFILTIDLITKETIEIPLNGYFESECTYGQVQSYRESLFFLPYQGNKILKYDTNKEELSEKNLPDDLLEEGKNGFCKLFSNEHILLASFEKNAFLICDEKMHNFQIIPTEIDREILLQELKKNKDLKYGDLVNLEIPNLEKYIGLEQFIQSIFEGGKYKKTSLQNGGNLIWKRLADVNCD